MNDHETCNICPCTPFYSPFNLKFKHVILLWSAGRFLWHVYTNV